MSSKGQCEVASLRCLEGRVVEVRAHFVLWVRTTNYCFSLHSSCSPRPLTTRTHSTNQLFFEQMSSFFLKNKLGFDDDGKYHSIQHKRATVTNFPQEILSLKRELRMNFIVCHYWSAFVENFFLEPFLTFDQEFTRILSKEKCLFLFPVQTIPSSIP
jgi:hypothetical protein